MVSIIPNWAELEGEVVRVEPSDRYPGFTAVHVRVQEVTPVEGFPDLLKESRGQVVPVLVRNDLAATTELDVGLLVTCRARRADRRTVFVDPRRLETRRPGDPPGSDRSST